MIGCIQRCHSPGVLMESEEWPPLNHRNTLKARRRERQGRQYINPGRFKEVRLVCTRAQLTLARPACNIRLGCSLPKKPGRRLKEDTLRTMHREGAGHGRKLYTRAHTEIYFKHRQLPRRKNAVLGRLDLKWSNRSVASQSKMAQRNPRVRQRTQQ